MRSGNMCTRPLQTGPIQTRTPAVPSEHQPRTCHCPSLPQQACFSHSHFGYGRASSLLMTLPHSRCKRHDHVNGVFILSYKFEQKFACSGVHNLQAVLRCCNQRGDVSAFCLGQFQQGGTKHGFQTFELTISSTNRGLTTIT